MNKKILIVGGCGYIGGYLTIYYLVIKIMKLLYMTI